MPADEYHSQVKLANSQPDQLEQPDAGIGKQQMSLLLAPIHRSKQKIRNQKPWFKGRKLAAVSAFISVVMLLAVGGILLLKTNILADTKAKTSHQQILPHSWTYNYSSACQASLPIPPKQKPYLDNTTQKTRFWQKEEYSTEQNGLTTSVIRAVFKYPEEPEESIPAQIIIYCSPNSNKDTTDTYYNKVVSKIKSDPAFANLVVHQKTTMQLWGYTIDKFTAKAQNGDIGQYYFFATKKHIYLVRPVSQSSDKTIQSTALQIFNLVSFQPS